MGATAPSQQATAPGATPPAAHDDAIEVQPTEAPVEEDEFETSDYDASSTASTSVTSSIYHHHYENGRRVRLPFPLNPLVISLEGRAVTPLPEGRREQ